MLWSALCVGAYLAIFHFPFWVPPHEPTLSAAYSAGFNNRVASIAAVLSGLLSFALARSLRESTSAPRVGGHSLPISALWIALLVYGVLLAIASAFVVKTPHAYGEANYFLNRIDQIAVSGRVPFKEFEFAYGPLLLYVPVLVHLIGTPLHLSLEWSYYLSLMLFSLLGVWALFWVVDELIPGYRYKLTIFGLFALIGLNPTMGMNYMYLRFIGPYIALLIAERLHTWQRLFAFISLSSVALFSISPEMGLAFSIGASGLSICRGLGSGFRLLACVGSAWVGPLLLLATFGTGYLQTFSAFSKGAQNFVIVPVPHIVLFLVALIFVIPLAVARWNSSQWQSRPGITGMLLCSIFLVPAALGRCDVGHVFWDGFGVILLSLYFSCSFTSVTRILWLGLVSVVFLHGVLTGLHFYARQIVPVIGVGIRAYAPRAEGLGIRLIPTRLRDGFAESGTPQMDTSRLLAQVGNAKVAVPFGADKSLTRMLKDSGVYASSFFSGLTNVFDADAEKRAIADVDHCRWALIPKDIWFADENIDFVRKVFSFPVRYCKLREPYRPGKHLLTHVESKWQKQESIGQFWLYCNNMLGACPPQLDLR